MLTTDFGAADVFIHAYDTAEGTPEYAVDVTIDHDLNLRGTFDDLGIAGACFASQAHRWCESNCAVEEDLIHDTLDAYVTPPVVRDVFPAIGKHFRDGLSTSDFLTCLTWLERLRFARRRSGEVTLVWNWLSWRWWTPGTRKAMSSFAAVNVAMIWPGAYDTSFGWFSLWEEILARLVCEGLLLGYQRFEFGWLLCAGTMMALALGNVRLLSIPLQLLVNDLSGVTGPPMLQVMIYSLIAAVAKPSQTRLPLELILAVPRAFLFGLGCFLASFNQNWPTAIAVFVILTIQSLSAAADVARAESVEVSFVMIVLVRCFELGPLTTAAAFRILTMVFLVIRAVAGTMHDLYGENWRSFLFWRALHQVGLARDRADSIRAAGKRIPLRLAGDVDDPCPICFDSIAGDELVAELPCGHVFHGECIRPWFWQDAPCPLCRAPV